MINGFRWFVLSVSLVFFSLGVSWKICSLVNFNYSIWYDTLSINKTIAKYSPQNKFDKISFEYTNKEQHVLLFSQIVDSISNDGEYLDEIFFSTHQADNKFQLLTKDEIDHLKDVSILVNQLFILWCFNILFLITANIYFIKREYNPPELKVKGGIVFCTMITIVGGFYIYGFTAIFYYLHTLVFPDNHKWFFYYQDSLMSTLMKAPDLFEVIAVMILIVSLPIYYIGKKLLSLFNEKITGRK